MPKRLRASQARGWLHNISDVGYLRMPEKVKGSKSSVSVTNLAS